MTCRNGWCGECYSKARGRSPGHGADRRKGKGSRRKVGSEMLRKRQPNEVPGTAANAPWDPASGVGELTWEFLTSTVWAVPEGGKREPGTITLFLHQGRLKAVLSDKDANESAFVTLDSSENVLEAIEHALESTSTEWRPQDKKGWKK